MLKWHINHINIIISLKKGDSRTPMIEQKKALYEAAVKKMSATDVVIYSDKTPKSLYEYYYYSYKESDIENLINNLRMSFDSWDKSYNLYKTSNAIEEISGGDISVLYEDNSGNLFIYSFATKKIYYYDKDNAPYVEIKYPMTIRDFLDVAKRDFEALGRTPYGKKFVTESSVLMEGIKEVFGFGTAIRIFIDGKEKKNAKVFDKHSYAFIDALLNYSDKLLTRDEFERLCARKGSKIEVYTNRKLGTRDEDRSNEASSIALEEEYVDSFEELMKKYSVDKDVVWFEYNNIKTAITMLTEGWKHVNKYLKGNKLFASAYIHTNMNWYLERPLLLQEWDVPIWKFDVEKYQKAYLANIKSRLEKFSPSDMVLRFEAGIEAICAACNSVVKDSSAKFSYVYNKPESYVKSECKGHCWIILTSVYKYESHYLPEICNANYVRLFNKSLVKEDFIDKFEDLDISTEEYSKYLESLDSAALEAGIYAVLEREGARDVAHKVRDAAEKVGKAVGNAARKAKDVFSPLMQKVRKTIEAAQKDQEDSVREEIITDSLFIKLRNLFKSAIVPIGAYYFAGPAIAIVTFLVQRWMKTDDDKIRGKIVRELEVELKLTREKIEDAKGDNARKEKYELMRLESKIEDELARIKYGKRD